LRPRDAYRRLVDHLSSFVMGYPFSQDLEEVLRANFTPVEAEITLALPSRVIALQLTGIEDMIEAVRIPREELKDILEGLSQRGLLFSAWLPISSGRRERRHAPVVASV
jgi:hypothetical protein